MFVLLIYLNNYYDYTQTMISITLAIPAFLIGVLFLWKGSDILVDGTSKTAARLGISSLIITEDSDYATVDDQVITFNYPNGILEENVTITVSDGELTDSQDIKVTIIALNDAPTISGVDNQTAIEDVDLILNVTPYIDDVDDEISSLYV